MLAIVPHFSESVELRIWFEDLVRLIPPKKNSKKKSTFLEDFASDRRPGPSIVDHIFGGNGSTDDLSRGQEYKFIRHAH